VAAIAGSVAPEGGIIDPAVSFPVLIGHPVERVFCRQFQTSKDMKNSLNSPMTSRLLLTLAVAVVGISSLWAEDAKKADPALSLPVHPQVFSLIQGWESDTECPVVTEINLDAVEKARNQFSTDEIKQEGDWTVVREADDKGFKRYRVLEQNGGHFKVEYQENGGGTLTTSSVIEFTLATRELKRNGKTANIRVIRVDDFTSK
jgi:hypothetical protein